MLALNEREKMIQKLKPLALCLCLLGILPAYASNTATISSRTDQLEQQLTKMQNELQSLKGQVRHTHKTKSHKSASHTVKATDKTQDSSTTKPTDYVVGPQNLPTSGAHYLGYDPDAPGQAFVSTGPYLRTPISYSGTDLIINSPSINEDVSLLNVRKNIRQRLRAMNIPVNEDHAHLLLSGNIEAQGLYKHPGAGPASTDIDVTNVALDAFILGPSHWLTGLMSFGYDNDLGTNSGSLNNKSRTQNSRVFINNAFITFGDFEVTPFYATIGQMYVPFGTYSSNMVSSPLTKVIARIKARAIVAGIQQQTDNGFYGSAFIFKGDTHAGSTSRVDNGGVNAGYHFVDGKIRANFGGGYVANIADSQGMQNTGGAPLFDGFGGPAGTGNERIAHHVPAIDVRGLLSIGTSIDLLAEYIGAVSSFNNNDLTYSSHGAKPQALNAEAAYTFSVLDKPTSVAIGYGKTKDALAIGVPLARMSMTLNTSIWKDTLQSLEFRHDINYAASIPASGSDVAAPSASGKSDNVVTAQIDMYF